VKELLTEVQGSVWREYQRAAIKFGPANNGPHESYAVILEELEEAQSDGRAFEYNMREFWNAVKANNTTKCQLQQMQTLAEHAAAEWVQVAAMCYKAQQKKADKSNTGRQDGGQRHL